MSTQVQRATPADAAEILRVHFAAVHETPAPHYPDEVIRNWSPPFSEDRVERVERAIEGGEELMVVARRGETEVGFGSIVPRHEELRALYVHPAAGGQGVGTQILRALEEMAVSLGLGHLQVEASVNAEAF